MIKPTIIIQISQSTQEVRDEIVAGIEEEGVLYEVVYEKTLQSACMLAQVAAQMSQLEVGIGIYGKEAILTTHKLSGQPLLHTNSEYRALGQNAARYVKGNSFTQMIGGEL